MGGAFGGGHVGCLIAKFRETFLQVKRHRIINLASDPATLQMSHKIISLTAADDKLIVDVTRGISWQQDILSQLCLSKVAAISVSVFSNGNSVEAIRNNSA